MHSQSYGIRCPKNHRHITLVDGRPKAAVIYHQGLCQAICQGYMDHMEAAVHECPVLLHRSPSGEAHDDRTCDIDHVTIGGINAVFSELEEHLELAICEEVGEPLWEADDDVNGGTLDPTDVLRARVIEMQYIRKRGVYKIATRTAALRVTGRIINTMLIDTSKGDAANPNFRSRFVAKEYRGPGHTAIFVGTPPLESLRAFIRLCASQQKGPMSKRLGVICVDVSRAHFYALALRRVFFKLRAEDPASADPDAVGELCMSMYGTQDASANWEAAYCSTLIDGGFNRGLASSCHFLHESGTTPTMVH